MFGAIVAACVLICVANAGLHILALSHVIRRPIILYCSDEHRAKLGEGAAGKTHAKANVRQCAFRGDEHLMQSGLLSHRCGWNVRADSFQRRRMCVQRASRHFVVQ